MDVSQAVKKPTGFFLAALGLILLVILWMIPSKALAYNSLTHQLITRNAFDYLRSHKNTYSETSKWTASQNVEDILIRADVDADYRTDFWMTGIFHSSFAGAQSDGHSAFFTSLLHFINVTVPGNYWNSDGYAYRNSGGQGNDGYLGSLTLTVQGELSAVFGGSNHEHPQHGAALGPYNVGFQASSNAWQQLFFGGASMKNAILPPANVPAQLAYNAMLVSPRASVDRTESWNETVPLITGLTSTGYLQRHYWRGEAAGYPKNLDMLGMTLHMAQDMTVPQHAEGTTDWCHQDLEDLADRLACNTNSQPGTGIYDDGTFTSENYSGCTSLYDERLVKSMLESLSEVRPAEIGSGSTIFDKLREIALLSARWQWGEPNNATDFLETRLPDGSEFFGDTCNDLIKEKAVQNQLRYQYNLAVAATVSLFEMAAHDYERAQTPTTAEFSVLSIH
jgi:hypothetical protein